MVKILREIRDQINIEIQNMSKEELKEYFRARLSLHPSKYKPDEGEISAA